MYKSVKFEHERSALNVRQMDSWHEAWCVDREWKVRSVIKVHLEWAARWGYVVYQELRSVHCHL